MDNPVHPPVDLSSPHIPSMHPFINRHTLKELDLDSILRNPQLLSSYFWLTETRSF
ncbi:hypothetical protein DFH29DRAFT_912289 [Suillus ampliporus]|nr:hypothetical protein DFH29DRAFT_912289 [Suillus ampliporus]